MLKNGIKKICCCLVMLFAMSQPVFCWETYFIGGDPVLLYKIINWWYYAPPEESDPLCGQIIKYSNQGHARFEYNGLQRLLKLHIEGGLADQMSILRESRQDSGPAYLACTWLSREYFGLGEAVDIHGEDLSSGILIFKNIEKHNALKIQERVKEIAFQVEGQIVGLTNGKIALHQGRALVRTCPGERVDSSVSSSISFKIYNVATSRVLADYSAVYE